MFGHGPIHEVMYVDNSRRDIPYPEAGPLSQTRRCDAIDVPEVTTPSSPARLTYRVSQRDHILVMTLEHSEWVLSMIDGGANGYVCGKDMRPLEEPHPSDRKVHITGVGQHQILDKRIGSFAAVSRCQKGERLVIVREGADVPEQPTTIHSACRLRHYKNIYS